MWLLFPANLMDENNNVDTREVCKNLSKMPQQINISFCGSCGLYKKGIFAFGGFMETIMIIWLMVLTVLVTVLFLWIWFLTEWLIEQGVII